MYIVAAIMTGGQGEHAITLTAWALSFMVSWVYFAAMECSSKQATLGKMTLGIIVTDVDGETLSFGRASARYFAKILSAATLGIGYLLIAFNARKQGLHDLIAGTLVVTR